MITNLLKKIEKLYLSNLRNYSVELNMICD